MGDAMMAPSTYLIGQQSRAVTTRSSLAVTRSLVIPFFDNCWGKSMRRTLVALIVAVSACVSSLSALPQEPSSNSIAPVVRALDISPGLSIEGIDIWLQLLALSQDTRSEEHTSELQSLMRISY